MKNPGRHSKSDNRWLSLDELVNWSVLQKEIDRFQLPELPLPTHTILAVMLIQKLDRLSDVQIGQLLMENRYYSLFAKAESYSPQAAQWRKAWQVCLETLGSRRRHALQKLLDRELQRIGSETLKRMGFWGAQSLAAKPNEHKRRITYREFRILCMMADGLSVDDIAAKLFIASSTVRTHRRNVRRKLQIKDRSARRILLYREWVERLRPLFEQG